MFENDFPALLPDRTPIPPPANPMFASDPVRGRCKVICFHPRHDLTLARMGEGEVVAVIEGWKGVYREEGEMLRRSAGDGEAEGYVQIFEVSEEFLG